MIVNRKGPCFKCKKRVVGCHSDCKEYLEWLKEFREYTETVRKEKQASYISAAHTIDSSYKNKKRKHVR